MNNFLKNFLKEVSEIYQPPQSQKTQWYATYDEATGKVLHVTVEPGDETALELSDEDNIEEICFDPSIRIVDGKITRINILRKVEETPNILYYHKDPIGKITTSCYNMLILKEKGQKWNDKKD